MDKQLKIGSGIIMILLVAGIVYAGITGIKTVDSEVSAKVKELLEKIDSAKKSLDVKIPPKLEGPKAAKEKEEEWGVVGWGWRGLIGLVLLIVLWKGGKWGIRKRKAAIEAKKWKPKEVVEPETGDMKVKEKAQIKENLERIHTWLTQRRQHLYRETEDPLLGFGRGWIRDRHRIDLGLLVVKDTTDSKMLVGMEKIEHVHKIYSAIDQVINALLHQLRELVKIEDEFSEADPQQDLFLEVKGAAGSLAQWVGNLLPLVDDEKGKTNAERADERAPKKLGKEIKGGREVWLKERHAKAMEVCRRLGEANEFSALITKIEGQLAATRGQSYLVVKVVDEDDKSVENAQVNIGDSSKLTDSNGMAKMHERKEGKTQITVVDNKFYPSEDEVELGFGKIKKIKVKLFYKRDTIEGEIKNKRTEEVLKSERVNITFLGESYQSFNGVYRVHVKKHQPKYVIKAVLEGYKPYEHEFEFKDFIRNQPTRHDIELEPKGEVTPSVPKELAEPTKKAVDTAQYPGKTREGDGTVDGEPAHVSETRGMGDESVIVDAEGLKKALYNLADVIMRWHPETAAPELKEFWSTINRLIGIIEGKDYSDDLRGISRRLDDSLEAFKALTKIVDKHKTILEAIRDKHFTIAFSDLRKEIPKDIKKLHETINFDIYYPRRFEHIMVSPGQVISKKTERPTFQIKNLSTTKQGFWCRLEIMDEHGVAVERDEWDAHVDERWLAKKIKGKLGAEYEGIVIDRTDKIFVTFKVPKDVQPGQKYYFTVRIIAANHPSVYEEREFVVEIGGKEDIHAKEPYVEQLLRDLNYFAEYKREDVSKLLPQAAKVVETGYKKYTDLIPHRLEGWKKVELRCFDIVKTMAMQISALATEYLRLRTGNVDIINGVDAELKNIIGNPYTYFQHKRSLLGMYSRIVQSRPTTPSDIKVKITDVNPRTRDYYAPFNIIRVTGKIENVPGEYTAKVLVFDKKNPNTIFARISELGGKHTGLLHPETDLMWAKWHTFFPKKGKHEYQIKLRVEYVGGYKDSEPFEFSITFPEETVPGRGMYTKL